MRGIHQDSNCVGISLNRLIKDISIVISKYDSFGSESDYGNKSNRAYINALKRFEEYIQSIKYLYPLYLLFTI